MRFIGPEKQNFESKIINISLSIRSRGYTTFSLLNSAEHEIYEGLDGGGGGSGIH